MKLIILIPSYNEEETIAEVIKRVPSSFEGIEKHTILVIDDGSTDDTVALAENSGATVISHQENRGVGATFTTGLIKSLELGADIMVNIDADGQFDPSQITNLIQPILEDKADFVSGDRFTNANGQMKKPLNMAAIKFWGNRVMSRLISLLSGKSFNDVSCGFRAYSKEAMLWLNLIGEFTYTQESFLDFAHKGLRIVLVPVDVKYVADRKSKVAGNLFHYIIRTMKIITRAYRDYYPMRFFFFFFLFPFIIGFACGIFMLIHYIQTRVFTPYKHIGFIGIYLGSLALLLWIVGLLADMFRRMRSNQEKLLYFEKKRQYSKE